MVCFAAHNSFPGVNYDPILDEFQKESIAPTSPTMKRPKTCGECGYIKKALQPQTHPTYKCKRTEAEVKRTDPACGSALSREAFWKAGML